MSDNEKFWRETVAHQATLAIRPDASGDAEYWRIRAAVSSAIENNHHVWIPDPEDEKLAYSSAMTQWEKSLKRPDMDERHRVRGALDALVRQLVACEMIRGTKLAEGDGGDEAAWSEHGKKYETETAAAEAEFLSKVQEPFGLSPEKIKTLLDHGLKPEEIGGPQNTQASRVRELLHWFVRLTQGNANPKWTREHAMELAYYVATTDDRAPFDPDAIRREGFIQGLKATADERRLAVELGMIESDPLVPVTRSSAEIVKIVRDALADAQEELRLIRMKDSGAVYDTMLRHSTIPLALQIADNAIAKGA